MANETETPTPQADEHTESTDTAAPAADVATDSPDAPKRGSDADYIAKLKKEAATRRVEAKGLREQIAQRDADLAELKEQLAQLDTLAAQRDAATLAANQYRAAVEAGIPVHLAPRLAGSTAEELAADAQALKQVIGGVDVGQRFTPPSTGQTPRNSLVR